MDVVCQDHKLNLSKYYLKPGFAFGGSCLPKDVRALTYRAGQLDVEHPLLASIMPSNRAQVQRAYDIISTYDKRRVGLLGLSFKAGTDDLRESPLVELAEMLIGKGFELRIYDSNVEYARVFGANKEYIESKIPHVSSLLCKELEDVVEASDVLILGNNEPLFAEVLQNLGNDKQVVDLVGFMKHSTQENREGICW
jgi:GDP-mannose 6-dehydrogenase